MTATITTDKRRCFQYDGGLDAKRAPSGSRWALFAVVGGLALIIASGALALRARPAMAHPPRPASTPTAAAAALPNIGTASETYKPGHSSGWHVHPGVHSVVVLSGTLTIYDEHCVRTDYGPGEIYLGGNAPHLARNEGTDDVDVAITYIYSSTSQTPGTPVAAPAGCDAR